jgi:hypothetical protein
MTGLSRGFQYLILQIVLPIFCVKISTTAANLVRNRADGAGDRLLATVSGLALQFAACITPDAVKALPVNGELRATQESGLTN